MGSSRLVQMPSRPVGHGRSIVPLMLLAGLAHNLFALAPVRAQSREPATQPTLASPIPEVRSLASPRPSGAIMTPQSLFAYASPAVVSITTKDEEGYEIGTASGFLIDAFGIKDESKERFYVTVVTNMHVIRSASSVSCSMLYAGSRKGAAQALRIDSVIAEDESSDLAILHGESDQRPTRTLTLAGGPRPPVGTRVFAIGNPGGFTNSLSEGLISGYRGSVEDSDRIQTTAAVSPGSSGGPLMSSDGMVLGVVSSSFSGGQNLNFAVPAEQVRRLQEGPSIWRALWRGASIQKEEDAAFIVLKQEFFKKSIRPELRYARLAFNTGNHDEARDWLRQAFNSQNSSPGYDDQLNLLYGAHLYFELHRYKEAAEVLDRALKAKSSEYEYLVHYMLAQTLFTEVGGTDIDRSIESLRRVVELKPDFAPAYDDLWIRHNMQGLYPEALLDAESLVRLIPHSPRALRNRGLTFAHLGREESAEKDLRAALALSPRNPSTHDALGKAYGSLGRLADAVAAHRTAVELAPESWTFHFSLAGAYKQVGLYTEAVESLETALKLSEKAIDEQGRDLLRRLIIECRVSAAMKSSE